MRGPSPNTTHPTRRWSHSQLKSMRTVSWHLALLQGCWIKRRSRRCLTKSRVIRFKQTWIAAYCLASGSMKKKHNHPLFRLPIRPLLIKSIVASFKVLNNQVATYPREFLQTSMSAKLFRVGSKLRLRHCRRYRLLGRSPWISTILPKKRETSPNLRSSWGTSLNLRSSYANLIKTRMTKYWSWLKP